jgi:hypothetical protein
MGCNCKKTPQVINNLKSQQHLQIADEIMTRVVGDKTWQELEDIDFIEVYAAYNILYPNASQVPSREMVLEHIRNGLQFLKKKN